MDKITWKNVKVKLGELKPWSRNPRQILAPQVEKLRESFSEFGQVETIAIGPEFQVYNGHQRLSVLLMDKGPEYIVDTRQSSRPLTEKEREKLTILLHRGATGEWDWDSLGNFDFEELVEWGFSAEELIGRDVTPKDPPEARLDEAEELLKEWDVKTGDLWALGGHRIICGDSTDPDLVARLMDGKMARMCHTDPPYNVDYGVSKNPRHHIRSMEGDKQSTDDWMSFVNAFGLIIKSYTSGDCYVWGASGPDGMRMRLALIDLGLHWSATIIWKKQQFVMSPSKYQRIYEPVMYGHFNESSFVGDEGLDPVEAVSYDPGLYGWFGDKSSFRGDRRQVEVWEFDRPHNSKYHPTMKPVDLCERAILNSSKPGDIVLDLFLGAGSTLLAADRMGRVCYGAELDPKYIAVTLQRYLDMTGNRPKKVTHKGVTK